VAAMWWTGFTGAAVLVTVVCGLAGLAYLVVRPRGSTPFWRPEQEPTRHDIEGRVDRQIPPRS
jgi:hypothetical protein